VFGLIIAKMILSEFLLTKAVICRCWDFLYAFLPLSSFCFSGFTVLALADRYSRAKWPSLPQLKYFFFFFEVGFVFFYPAF
jgi:hypothetical protein